MREIKAQDFRLDGARPVVLADGEKGDAETADLWPFSAHGLSIEAVSAQAHANEIEALHLAYVKIYPMTGGLAVTGG